MASIVANAIIFFAALASGSVVVEQKERTITQVVKLLQTMLKTSKAQGEEERVIYGKFKCYCDRSEEEKKASIKKLDMEIALLESNIEETQGSTGALSSDCADLKAKMAANKKAVKEATGLREREHTAYVAEKADLEQAIEQMKNAIEVLSEVGADQTQSTGADNKQFMAGYKQDKDKPSMLSLQTEVRNALKAATALMNPTQASQATAFLQAPFTGTYTSQSAQVMGILKDMRDTFEANVMDAQEKEDSALEEYNKLITIKKQAFGEMEEFYNSKQKELGDNDGSLGADKQTLADGKMKRDSDTEFLEELLPMCEKKAKGYADRKLLRANEEHAIAEAISILNSDEAFATFQDVSATTTGKKLPAFIQLRSVHKHIIGGEQGRHAVQEMLQVAAKDASSARLSKVASLLEAANPFETVLKEIDAMLKVIYEEGQSDKENLDWCNEERDNKESNQALREKEMLSLEKQIGKLKKTIADPEDGLKAIIQETEESLLQNREDQNTATNKRRDDNAAYQKDVKNLAEAQVILGRAIKTLVAYYADLEEKLQTQAAFVQQPSPPEAWKGDGAYEGQKADGSGKDGVIDQLQFILSETAQEETDAHQAEKDSQNDYDKLTKDLKKQEKDDEKLLAKTQETLAETEKDLLTAQEDLKATTTDRDSIVDYLKKIAPGCDFITEHFSTREANRKTEKEALKKAMKGIKGTPAYKAFGKDSEMESFGDCVKLCTIKNPDYDESRNSLQKDVPPRLHDAAKVNHAECQACMADVSVAAYCAGHKDTDGCKREPPSAAAQ